MKKVLTILMVLLMVLSVGPGLVLADEDTSYGDDGLCTEEGPAVCGEDGEEYDNECEAEKAGTEAACEGSCPCTEDGVVVSASVEASSGTDEEDDDNEEDTDSDAQDDGSGETVVSGSAEVEYDDESDDEVEYEYEDEDEYEDDESDDDLEEELEDSVEEESLTESEVEIVATIEDSQGANLRLLQLKHRVTRNLLYGQEIYAYIQADLSVEDEALLSAQLAKLEAILADVDALFGVEATNEVALEFVVLKREAISVSQSFRVIARNYITSEEDREAIKAALEETEFEELDEIESEVETARLEFNAKQIQRVSNKLGIELSAEVVAKLESGEIDVQDAKKRLRAEFKELSAQERRRAAQKAQEEAAKRRVAAQAKVSADGEIRTKVKARLAERDDDADERKDEVRLRLEARDAVIKGRVDARLQNRVDSIRDEAKDRRDEALDRARDRREDARAEAQASASARAGEEDVENE